jgi:protein-S-isoprenylcysteine O-methyltransferase Ste14
MGLSFTSSSLAASFLACTYLVLKVLTPPNPAPPQNARWKKDTLMRRETPQRRVIGLSFFFLSWSFHIFFILFPPTSPSIICPHPSRLDIKFFTWSSYTAFYMAVIFIAAPIRALAYSQLGQNFTFTLAKPKGLIKTGLYKYVRHPSYPPLYLCVVAYCALMLRSGGVAGCWIPEWLVGWKGLDVGGLVFLLTAYLVLLGVRVTEEEEMLRSEFGVEYEEYARRTKRFLPGII